VEDVDTLLSTLRSAQTFDFLRVAANGNYTLNDYHPSVILMLIVVVLIQLISRSFWQQIPRKVPTHGHLRCVCITFFDSILFVLLSGGLPETVQFSDDVIKINDRGRKQTRYTNGYPAQHPLAR
jgi:hypothetical protein